MEFKRFDDVQKFITESAAYMAGVCRDVGGECYIGLAGGKTPGPVYEQFSREDIDPRKIHLFQVDERYTPASRTSSNWHMIQTSLVAQRDEEWGSVTTFDVSLPIDEAVQKYEKSLPAAPFDLMVLGVGTDGHIGSLFPNSLALNSTYPVAHTTTDAHVVHDRLTLTPEVMLKAKNILVLLSGEGKRAVFEELQHPTKEINEFPAHMLQDHDNTTIFFVG